VRKRTTNGTTGVEARILSTLLNEIDGVGISSDVYETTSRLVLRIE
jgi:SpoVK/Ycf46/Vps4 family AAA+-type ATPase